MAKFYGIIGYAETVETRPGVWVDRIIEKNSYGDVLKNTKGQAGSPDSVNDDLTINNRISIIADPYAATNFHSMKYVEFMGAKWKITNVEVQYPRLILSVGGVYNG
jgi:hypothetical protein